MKQWAGGRPARESRGTPPVPPGDSNAAEGAPLDPHWLQRAVVSLTAHLPPGHETDAEDVLQDAWVAHLEKGEETEVRNLNAFLYKIARDKLRDHLRATRRHERAVLRCRLTRSLSHSGNPSESLQAVDTRLDLEAFRARLRPEEAAVLDLKAQGLTVREIHELVGSSRSEVQRTLDRLRTTLGPFLEIPGTGDTGSSA